MAETEVGTVGKGRGGASFTMRSFRADFGEAGAATSSRPPSSCCPPFADVTEGLGTAGLLVSFSAEASFLLFVPSSESGVPDLRFIPTVPVIEGKEVRGVVKCAEGVAIDARRQDSIKGRHLKRR